MNILKALNGWKSYIGIAALVVIGILANHGVEVPADVVIAVKAWAGFGLAHKLAKAGK